MGLMNRMRDKTHIILIILVLAFLATIVFDWGMGVLGLKRDQISELGYVNGEPITYQQFEQQVQFAIEQQKQQTGQEPDEAMVEMIRNQVWDQLVTQLLAKQQIEKLGIRVTDQEILDWIYKSPQTLPELIRRNFIDSTGNFDMAIYQQALTMRTPEVQQFWVQVEDYLRQTLLSQKLQSVVTGIVRVSEADVLQKYKDENIFANFDYVFLDINSVSDAQVQISDEDLKVYYDKHKDEFKHEERVVLKYVLFSDAPTMEDTIITEKQLRAMTKDLRTLNDSDLISFVNSNSETQWADKFVKPNEISAQVADYLFGAAKDSVSDVIKASDGYHLVRLLDSREGENVYTNASHILVKVETDSNAAKVKAEQILKRALAGEDFAKLASELSDDPGSKTNGGNLGWFTKGAMVKEFEAATEGTIGSIVGPIKTQFGYHIVKIHDRKKKEFKFADIKKPVKASIKTKDTARKRAEDFAYVSGKGNFDEEAAKINLQVADMPPITRNAFIPGAGDNKKIVKFAFSESRNSVSEPIKIQSGYAVYLITDKLAAAYMSFEELKDNTLRPMVIAEKKLDVLKQSAEELRKRISGNSLSSLKDSDPGINFQSADSVSVAKPNPQIGTQPEFNNVVFKLQPGQISEPIRTSRGYYIVQMNQITPFDPEKYKAAADQIRANLTAQKKQSIVQEWIAQLKEDADIVDNRDKYFR
jgi:peptidyl-prolyl cis-trans isomerase D